jgi:hypothetical protein
VTGRFDIELMPGRYDLLTWPQRGAPWHVGRFEVPTQARVDQGDLLVPDAGGLMVEMDGPAPQTIELTGDRGLHCELVPTSAHEWAARELQPGTYHVAFTKPGGGRVERDAEVHAGETARVTIALP